MTQEKLAQKTKGTKLYIPQLETDLREEPSLDILKRLATALKVPVAEPLR